MSERDEGIAPPPGKPWEFDEEVSAAFESMLSKSIPEYETMRELVADLAYTFVSRAGGGSTVVDLGASRGEALARVKELTTKGQICATTFHAVEISESMLSALEERWPEDRYLTHGVQIHAHDLRQGYPPIAAEAVVTLSVLTLQFVPIEYRQRILREIWRNLRPGGALILVEKVLGGSADLDELFVDAYYRLKAANGYSREAIERKRLSLEGVLVPVTSRMNEEFLRGAGFREVDLFWCWGPFRGWIAVKTKEA